MRLLLYLIDEMLQSIAAGIGQHAHDHVSTALAADIEGAYVDDGLQRQTQYARQQVQRRLIVEGRIGLIEPHASQWSLSTQRGREDLLHQLLGH